MSRRLVIDIRCDAPGWAVAAPDARAVARRAARAVWSAIRRDTDASGTELSIALVDDVAMRRLNSDWRGKDQPTNVLSFPAGDAGAPGRPVLLGDVVLALGTVRREAAELGRAVDDHVSHLVVHGVLHLLGYDHETEKQATAMEALETEILRGLGIADPCAVKDEPVG